MNETTLTYQEMTLSSRELIVPSSSYQRPFRPEHTMAITNKFDEHLANEPKVSYRGGNYYVFDGQHTIAARKNLNGGNDVLIKCKVYYDLTEEDEALLFAQQFGESSALTAGIRMRAFYHNAGNIEPAEPKPAQEESKAAFAPALDANALASLLTNNPELLAKVLKSVQLANS